VGEIRNCQVCGSADLTVILDMGSQPLAERFDHPATYPLVLQECGECTLIQLTYAVDQREVFPPDHPYATGNTRALVEHFMGLAGRVAQYLNDDDLIVDVGCNDGTLLGFVSDRVRRVGVEPADQGEKCAARGIHTWRDYWTAEIGNGIRALYGPAKVVTATNVLAHVPDPHDFVQGVVDLLDDDGVFVSENHDVNFIVEHRQYDAVYHEHLRYYSVTSLARLLQMHGLTVTGFERVPSHGGSMRVYARKLGTSLLGARAWRTAMDLNHLLAGIHRNGELIYGIGAATRAVPLIHYADIAGFVECVCEVPGSQKIGRNMPGTLIPVVDEAGLIEDQPGYALLFAWQWTESITRKLRAAGYKGRFIKPLPVPEVLDA
jgi:hypothetical protein